MKEKEKEEKEEEEKKEKKQCPILHSAHLCRSDLFFRLSCLN